MFSLVYSRRHQQHYHSQRREHPREKLDRPVSNFYEYESVQAAMHAQQQHGQGSQPQGQQQQQQPIYVVKNHNSNNGVTLPSPTTLPFNSVALRQRSPSQFQAVPPVAVLQSRQQFGNSHLNPNPNSSSATLQLLQHQKQIQQQQQIQQKPNSLPRRNQKGN